MTDHGPGTLHDHGDDHSTSPDVLVVCTANVARSPLLASRLQLEADRRLGPDRALIESAGVEPRFGDRAAQGSQVVASRWGTNLEGHTSKSVTYVPLAAVPLTIVMAGSHRRALIARNEGLAASSFTALELMACLERLGAERRLPVPSAAPADRATLRGHIEEVVRLAHEARPAQRWWSRRHLDIPDPIGAGQGTFDELGRRFVELSEVLGEILFGPSRP